MASRLALAMSAAALVVALLGSTPLGHALVSQFPRNSVGPLQIKRNAVGPQKIAPNAIRTGHVLDGSLLTADFKPGQIPQGPKGEKGERGSVGPPGVSAREVVRIQSAANSVDLKQITATCPAGKVAIGGGGGVSGLTGNAALRFSEPNDLGWFAAAWEIVPTNSNWFLSATAVCVKVSP